MKKTKKNTKKMAQDLRRRAEVRKREASLAIQLSKKLEEEGKHEEASATRMAAAEDIKIADKWIKTANEMDPIEVEPQEESSTFEWAPPDEEPVEEEPSDEEPSDEEPVEEEPSDEEPSDEEPSDEEPSDEEPSDEEPSDEEPFDEEPSDEEPSDEEPSDEEPSDEEPSDEEPFDEEPSDEEPSDEEPSDEEPSDEEPSDEEPSDEDSKPTWLRWVPWGMGISLIALLLALIALLSQCNGTTSDNPDKIPDDTTVDITDTTVPEEPVQEPEEIDLTKFITSVVNIIEGRSNEGSAIWNNVSKVCTDNEEELERLIEEYGEKDVKNKIADSLHGIPIIMMNHKIKVDKLEYHLDPEGAFDATYEDLNNKFNEADLKAKAEFANTTGLDTEPQGLIMTLPGYAQNSSNRAAIREIIKTTYSGKTQTALIDYYNEYTTSWDMCNAGIKKAKELKAKRIADTQTALNFKKEVEIKLITSENFIKLLEEQLKEIDSAAYDYISMEYSQEYVEFVLKNFDAVIG